VIWSLALALALMAHQDTERPPGLAPDESVYRWYTLESRSAGFGVRQQTDIRVYRVSRPSDGGAAAFWMVRLRYAAQLPGVAPAIDRWLDSRACPAISEALTALPREALQPTPPGEIRTTRPRLGPHGAEARYTAYGILDGSDVEMTLVDRQEGAIHRAAEQMRDLLLPCAGPAT
jgi:hypothetical protein